MIHYLIAIIIILLIIYFLYDYGFIYDIEYFDVPTSHERPFVNVYDDNNNQLKIVLLSHPFTRDSSWKQYENYKRDNFLILGITSYNEFPQITSNKHDVLNNPQEKAWKNYKYMEVVDAWLYCFRKPEDYITDKNIPKLLLSESDFTKSDIFKPDASVEKVYDFIYICPKDGNDCDGWVSTNKNWELGKKCIEILCAKKGLKGILVGRKGCELPKGCEKHVETTGFLSQNKLIETFRKSKFILVPNQTDASPRILTEALCCNVPALVNYNILGGWKYINNETGAFFTSEKDLENGLNHIVNNYSSLKPREYYLNNYGKINSGKKFKKFIKKHFNDKVDVSNYKYITL